MLTHPMLHQQLKLLCVCLFVSKHKTQQLTFREQKLTSEGVKADNVSKGNSHHQQAFEEHRFFFFLQAAATSLFLCFFY